MGSLELCEARAFVIDVILRANGILLTALVALAALFLIPSNSTFLYYWQGGLFLEGFEVVRWITILFIGSFYFFSRDESRDAFVLITLALVLAALLPTLLYEGGGGDACIDASSPTPKGVIGWCPSCRLRSVCMQRCLHGVVSGGRLCG